MLSVGASPCDRVRIQTPFAAELRLAPSPLRAGDGLPLRSTRMTRIAINGFGRIGRNFFRAAAARKRASWTSSPSTTSRTRRRSRTSSSTTRCWAGSTATSQVSDGGIVVNGDEIRVLAERDPANLPWKDLGADVVLESTGFFTSRDGASQAPRRRRLEGDHLGARPPIPT